MWGAVGARRGVNRGEVVWEGLGRELGGRLNRVRRERRRFAMARKLALINYKGGVGKTSLTVNLAAELARGSRRVLVVDFDPQSNSSIWLMRLVRWNRLNSDRRKSLLAVFMPEGPKLKECIVPDVVQDNDGNALVPGLDLVPTTFNLMDLEHDWRPPEGKTWYEIFAENLKEVEADYDFILYDCAPNVFRGTQCALHTADEVYVPANPDALSLIGLSLFIEKAVRFHERSNAMGVVPEHGPAKVCGVVFNAMKAGVNSTVAKERIGMRLEACRTEKKVSGHARVFPCEVRDTVHLRRAVSHGLPVRCMELPRRDQGIIEDFAAIADEIIHPPWEKNEDEEAAEKLSSGATSGRSGG